MSESPEPVVTNDSALTGDATPTESAEHVRASATPVKPVDVSEEEQKEMDRELEDMMTASADDPELAELGAAPTGKPGESVESGAEMTGTVVGVSDDDVFLEFGAKSQGVMERGQFGKKELIEVGRRVDVVVDRYDQDSGLLIVYRVGAVQRANWNNLAVGMLVEGRVTGMIKGGLEVDLQGIRAFMPGSQASTSPMKDLSVLLNEKIRCEVVEVNRRSKNVIVSRRKQIQKDEAEARDRLRAELEVGQVRKGIVKNITEFGAFVDLGGLEGLVHISDLSWGTVEKVSDVVSTGQEIQVKVLKIDDSRGRISLGFKHAQPDPWVNVEERYPVGTQLKARVIRLVDFGAFVEVENGVEALVPISEMGWTHTKRPTDATAVGDMVDAVVIRMEPKKRRLALSMKQAQPDPWADVLESFTPQSLIQGRVTRLTDFGAFVELAPGIEGLVHISELSDRHVRACKDVLEEGQMIETRVLGVDQENRRISLSLRQVKTADSGDEAADAATESAKPKKRKKPLRGGLSSHYGW